MTLLCVSSWFPYPADFGAKLRAYHLLRHLARRHDIHLVSFAKPGEATEDFRAHLAGFCRRVEVVPGDPYEADVPLRWWHYLDRWPRSYRATYSPAMAERVAQRIEGCDVALGLQVGAALYLDALAARPRVFEEAELTVYLQGPTARRSTTGRWRQRLTWAKFSRFVSGLAASLDHATVVSDDEALLLRAALGRRAERVGVSVVPNGVDETLFDRPAVSRFPNRLIYPGALTYGANREAVMWFLAEVWPLVRAVRPDATFVVTGACPPEALLGLPPSPGVVFTGRLDDVYPEIASSALCVVPLRTGGGTRLKVLEAMALGTPVVATPKGVEGLDLLAGRHYLQAAEARRFAEEVIEVMARPAEARHRAAEARRFVAERYTWGRSAERLEVAIDAAVASHARRRLR